MSPRTTIRPSTGMARPPAPSCFQPDAAPRRPGLWRLRNEFDAGGVKRSDERSSASRRCHDHAVARFHPLDRGTDRPESPELALVDTEQERAARSCAAYIVFRTSITIDNTL